MSYSDWQLPYLTYLIPIQTRVLLETGLKRQLIQKFSGRHTKAVRDVTAYVKRLIFFARLGDPLWDTINGGKNTGQLKEKMK